MSAPSKPAVASEIDKDLRLLNFAGPLISKGNPDETGLDRLKQMFSYINGKPSPELTVVQLTVYSATFMGYLMGSLNYIRQAREQFRRRHYADKFLDGKEYARRFYDYQIIQSVRGGFKLGWRVGLCTSLYTLTVMSIAVYRDKFGVLEHITGGASTMAIYRCHMGLRGMWSASVIGAVFGGIAGCISLGTLKLAGVTLPQMRREGYEIWAEIWEKEERKRKEAMYLKMLEEQEKNLKGETA